jgi:thioredoxin reductase
LRRDGDDFVLLEQANQVAANWRKHYDRLHLHTNKQLSGLPDYPMPADYPAYPSRDQVVQYLEDYAEHHQLEPRFGQAVTRITRDEHGWITETQDNRYRSQYVVIATGYTRKPNIPTLPNQEAFDGEILHSSAYKNGEPYAGKSVLVVGFGNSGGEIAIDLHEHGAHPAISVRSAVNVIPRDLFGIPILGIGILLDLLPARLADWLSWPLLRLTIGDIEALGLRKLPYGPNQQIRRDAQIPLLNIGTVELLRERKLVAYPEIEHLEGRTVRFVDGQQAEFDAIVMATGYRPALADFLEDADAVTDSAGVPLHSGQPISLYGLFFCGFYVSPTGMLREISIEAKKIAAHIRGGVRVPVV